jgi:Flp pilus assembly CpaE family ATPase
VSVEVVGQVLSAADRALLVCDQSVLKSRQAKVWLRALRLAGFALDKLALVVDGYDKKMGIEPQQLAESLALPLLVSLPVQPQHRAEAMNLGQPLGQLHPKDPYYVGLMALVATWQGAVRPVKRWWR